MKHKIGEHSVTAPKSIISVTRRRSTKYLVRLEKDGATTDMANGHTHVGQKKEQHSVTTPIGGIGAVCTQSTVMRGHTIMKVAIELHPLPVTNLTHKNTRAEKKTVTTNRGATAGLLPRPCWSEFQLPSVTNIFIAGWQGHL